MASRRGGAPGGAAITQHPARRAQLRARRQTRLQRRRPPPRCPTQSAGAPAASTRRPALPIYKDRIGSNVTTTGFTRNGSQAAELSAARPKEDSVQDNPMGHRTGANGNGLNRARMRGIATGLLHFRCAASSSLQRPAPASGPWAPNAAQPSPPHRRSHRRPAHVPRPPAPLARQLPWLQSASTTAGPL